MFGKCTSCNTGHKNQCFHKFVILKLSYFNFRHNILFDTSSVKKNQIYFTNNSMCHIPIMWNQTNNFDFFSRFSFSVKNIYL